MTDWAFDPRRALRHLKASDPALAAVIARVGPFTMTLKSSRSLFAALAEAIVYQQLSTKAAATIYSRLEALFPPRAEGFLPHDILAARVDQLRAVGLSAAKVLALQDLARRVEAGELPTLAQATELEDEELVQRLVKVRGIGRWSAEMFLMFRLGRPDVLPLDDYSLRKAYAVAFSKRHLPAPRTLERHGRKWRPYRTVASWYLWRTLDLPQM